MENFKFEFYKFEVTYRDDKILKKLNQKFDSGENFSAGESVQFFTTHDMQILDFAGQNGWEIRAVINKVSKDGDVDTYYLQRSSEHSMYGKKTFREEYHESELYKQQNKERNRLMKRQV